MMNLERKCIAKWLIPSNIIMEMLVTLVIQVMFWNEICDEVLFITLKSIPLQNNKIFKIDYILVHEDPSEDHWWRGCKLDLDKVMGCSQHDFTHDGQTYVVDECVCDTPLCNKEMQPIPETTTKLNPETTTKG